MQRTGWDAVVIGGGPGGSAAATFLSRAGRKVLLLEKEHFPRFHIGESLLPYNTRIFKEMGVYERLSSAGLIQKYGAQFHLGDGTKSVAFVFRRGEFTAEPAAFQVERSRFDHELLKHARDSGAQVLEGWAAVAVRQKEGQAEVDATAGEGKKESFEAAYVLDASGRSNLTGNQEGLRMIHPSLRKAAVFGHFAGVKTDAGEKGGDTVIVRLENAWFWLIPLTAEKVSVGCVVDEKALGRGGSPADLFWALCSSSPPLRERMAQASLLGRLQVTGDFSYYNRRLVGPRLLRIGDAAGFMDPIFSAGVYLAMHSGKLAAGAVAESLAAPPRSRRLLGAYEKQVMSAMKFYWKMVEHFYTTPFLEVFLEPREILRLSSAVNAALAGRLDGAWAVRWRMQVFYGIVKLQARWPLLPRISFGGP